MKIRKMLPMSLSVGALIVASPYISHTAQALPINDVNDKEITTVINTFNIEKKNIKRNQKEEMAKLLVNLYNKYNEIFKRGLEINDVKNSSLYFNITKQKSEIKSLLDEIINYPYSIVNSSIEQKFIKSNVLYCYLTNQYIKGNDLFSLLNGKTFEECKNELKNILEIVNYSLTALENSKGNSSNINLNNKVNDLNNIINELNDFSSLNRNLLNINKILNEVYLDIDEILTDYIHL